MLQSPTLPHLKCENFALTPASRVHCLRHLPQTP